MESSARLNSVGHCVYLHGLGSSPGSAKATDLRRRLAPLGWSLTVPDLNRPSFERLSLSAQVEGVEELLLGPAAPPSPVVVGSSLGALVALMFANRHPDCIPRLILVAPAFRFVGDRIAGALGSDVATWERQGYLRMLHYADGQVHHLGFDLVRDALTHDFDALRPVCPTLVVHGTADELIPFERTAAWVREHPGAELVAIEGGDHSLGGRLDELWTRSKDFLLGAPGAATS